MSRQCIAINEALKQCAYVTGHSGEHLFPHGTEDLSDEIRLNVLRDRAAKDGAVIATLTRERDEARQQLDSLRETLQDLADDLCGLQPVMTMDECVAAITQHDFKLRQENERMRTVVEAAHRWATFGRDDNPDEYALLMAVRASKAQSLDELVRLTEEAGGYPELATKDPSDE